jgi:hypothetical protein
MLRGMFNVKSIAVGSNFKLVGGKVVWSLSQRFENCDQSGGLSAWDESVEEGGVVSLRRER